MSEQPQVDLEEIRSVLVSVAHALPWRLDRAEDSDLHIYTRGDVHLATVADFGWEAACLMTDAPGYIRILLDEVGRLRAEVQRLRRTPTDAAPTVWDPTIPPGGYVCAVGGPDGLCGMPVESEPCPYHHPDALHRRLEALERKATTTRGWPGE